VEVESEDEVEAETDSEQEEEVGECVCVCGCVWIFRMYVCHAGNGVSAGSGGGGVFGGEQGMVIAQRQQPAAAAAAWFVHVRAPPAPPPTIITRSHRDMHLLAIVLGSSSKPALCFFHTSANGCGSIGCSSQVNTHKTHTPHPLAVSSHLDSVSSLL
jgi:hypothetical protein